MMVTTGSVPVALQRGLTGFWYELRIDADRKLVMRMQGHSPQSGNVVEFFGDVDGDLLPVCKMAIAQGEWSRLVNAHRLRLADTLALGLSDPRDQARGEASTSDVGL